jgi:hypothetical protein
VRHISTQMSSIAPWRIGICAREVDGQSNVVGYGQLIGIID